MIVAYIKREVEHFKVLPSSVKLLFSDERNLGQTRLQHVNVATPADNEQ